LGREIGVANDEIVAMAHGAQGVENISVENGIDPLEHAFLPLPAGAAQPSYRPHRGFERKRPLFRRCVLSHQLFRLQLRPESSGNAGVKSLAVALDRLAALAPRDGRALR